VERIEKKSQVLHLGMNLKHFDAFSEVEKENVSTLLWNHRWEYDKNPELFFETLFRLKNEGVEYKLIVLGESYKKSPSIFEKAKTVLKNEIIYFGFAESWEEYARLLWKADILPVTSNQDFFGGSVVEAMYCKCFPILPNRLAYPEHIPTSFHPENLFSTPEEFFQKIKTAIIDSSKLRTSNHFQNFVAPYDWSILAKYYDQALEKICQQ